MLFAEIIDPKAKDRKPTEILIVLTGINKTILEDGVNEHGYQAVIDNPGLLNLSDEEIERIIEAGKLGHFDPMLL